MFVFAKKIVKPPAAIGNIYIILDDVSAVRAVAYLPTETFASIKPVSGSTADSVSCQN